MQVQQTSSEGHSFTFQVSGKEKTLELQTRCVHCVRILCIPNNAQYNIMLIYFLFLSSEHDRDEWIKVKWYFFL